MKCLARLLKPFKYLILNKLETSLRISTQIHIEYTVKANNLQKDGHKSCVLQGGYHMRRLQLLLNCTCKLNLIMLILLYVKYYLGLSGFETTLQEKKRPLLKYLFISKLQLYVIFKISMHKVCSLDLGSTL